MSDGGNEYVLRCGNYTAAITQIGAGIRSLRWADRDLLLAYRTGAVRPRFRGALLAPWPNRVADGCYRFGGATHQLDISEPERQTALHGLICWVRFDVVDQDASSVTLRHRLVPQRGYPFELELSAHYFLSVSGLTCAVTTRNLGSSPAPYGIAPHPYLQAGDGRVDDWTLQLPATEILEVTPDRLLPTAKARVAESAMDFREARTIGQVEIDHAFTGLIADADGLVRARLTRDDATGVECEWDPSLLPWVQMHTADLPDPATSRRALALEPMSCPPDAFNSGEHLVILRSQDQHTASWTIRAI